MRRIPVLLLLALCFSGRGLQADDATPVDKPDPEQPVRAAVQAYEEAFNQHDASAVGKSWAEDGVYVDRATGDRSVGRAAIESDLAEVFSSSGGIRLQLTISDIQFIRPDVAQVDATAMVFVPDEEPQGVLVAALLVKSDDQWLLSRVEEHPVVQPLSSHEALAPLEWLVGEWQDDAEESKSTSVFRWSPHGTFLIRSFYSQTGEELESEGTQIIGWDSRAKHIRSWTFHADGSFGEAIWTRSGGDWQIKSTQTLVDGGIAAGTYVMTPGDDDAMSVRLIGHELNGVVQPAKEPTRVVRVLATEADPVIEPAATQTSATGGTP